MMHQRGFFCFSIGFILVLSLASSEASAQDFTDNFNRPNQDTPPEGWTAFRGEWWIANGALVGEASNFDNNPLREAWIWAGDPPLALLNDPTVELSSTFELSFDMDFLGGANFGDRIDRHAGVMFCATRPTHRWDRAGGIGGYELDWLDSGRRVRLVRIDARFRGDANCDGLVNEADLDVISDHMATGTRLCCVATANADGDEEEIINVLDLVTVANFIAGRAVPEPVDCGEERTQVALGGSGSDLENPPRHWQILVDANTIRVLGDNRLILEVEDSHYRGGHLGFWARSNGTRVAYDNVMVSRIPLLTLEGQGNARLQPGVDGNDSKLFCFRAHRGAGAPGNTIVFSMEPSGGQEGDENILLMAWGRLPTRRDYDLAASVRGQASQRLVVPFARDENAYILLLAERDGGNGTNSVTVRAELPGIFLQELSVDSAVRPLPGPGGSPNRVTTSVFGGGFTQETNFRFTDLGRGVIPVVGSRFVSSNHVLLTMELTGTTPLGRYVLQASNGAADFAQLPGAFRVEARVNPGVLDVRLVVAGRVRPFRIRPLQVRYENTGQSALGARILRISPPEGVELRMESEGEFPRTIPEETEIIPVDILTVNRAGLPESLPAGASGVVNLLYRVNDRVEREDLAFELELLSPGEEASLCWTATLNCSAALERPPGIDENTWIAIAGNLDDVLGTELDQFVESIARLSTRLAFRGRDPASVDEALRLAIHTAWTQEDPSHSSAALSGVLRDSLGNPLGEARVAAVRGAERGCAETSTSGFFVIEGLRGGGAAYRLEVEGFDVTAELAVAVGGEASFGNVIAGGENNSPFECEILEDSLELATVAFSSNSLRLVQRRPIEVIFPVDPNYVTGTAGQSEGELELEEIETEQGKEFREGDQVESWIPDPEPGSGIIADGETIVYEITFQNDRDALAPAQDVNVVDILPEELDPATVQFLAVGVDYTISCVGTTAEVDFTNPLDKPVCSAYGFGDKFFFFKHTLTNARTENEDLDIYLQVTCRNVNEEGEQKLISEFRTTDSNRSLLSESMDNEMFGEPIDELGFLVPHNGPVYPLEGEAFVQFSVDVKKNSQVPGTLVSNQAEIHFLDIIGGGGGGGVGEEDGRCLVPVCATNTVFHLIPMESDFVTGCENVYDDDGDGSTDCADTDCAEDVFCAAPGGTLFVRGDSDSNGSINLTDGVVPLLFLFSGGAAPICMDATDANDSGAIEITDAIIIFSWLFTGGAAPVAPSPLSPGYEREECGDDLTDDDIGCSQVSPVCQ